MKYRALQLNIQVSIQFCDTFVMSAVSISNLE